MEPVGSAVKASCNDDNLTDALLPGRVDSIVKPAGACINVVCSAWGPVLWML